MQRKETVFCNTVINTRAVLCGVVNSELCQAVLQRMTRTVQTPSTAAHSPFRGSAQCRRIVRWKLSPQTEELDALFGRWLQRLMANGYVGMWDLARTFDIHWLWTFQKWKMKSEVADVSTSDSLQLTGQVLECWTVKATVGEYRQSKCNTISNPQPVKTLQQWADVSK